MICSGLKSYIQIESYFGNNPGDFMFYYEAPGMSGWFVGPSWCYYIHADVFGQSQDDKYPEDVGSHWEEYRHNIMEWVDSPGLQVHCFGEG